MKIKILFVCLISILKLNVSFGQDSASDILQNIRDKFETINDLSADLTQSVNGNLNFNGKVYYKKENKLRFEFKNILVISDGENAWNYNQKDNKVIITDYENEGNKILSLRQIIYEYPEDCEMSTYESEGQRVLELIPKNDNFSFNFIKLYLSNDYLIKKALIDDPASGTVELSLSDYQLNKNIPDSFFQFSPPEGSQVIDLR
jgi:outer membrane lipoprotein carrier protein